LKENLLPLSAIVERVELWGGGRGGRRPIAWRNFKGEAIFPSRSRREVASRENNKTKGGGETGDGGNWPEKGRKAYFFQEKASQSSSDMRGTSELSKGQRPGEGGKKKKACS